MLRKSKVLILIVFGFLVVMCKQNRGDKEIEETILTGDLTMVVDETLIPVIDDQIQIFEDKYKATIASKALSETESVKALLNQDYSVAILARDLTNEERKVFEQKKIIPRSTPFATDAIALIKKKNSNNNDTIIALQTVIEFLQGKQGTSISGIVFDNPNSSTVSYLNNLAGITAVPTQGVYSFKTNEEVIKFVSENENMIGVVGVNWLSQPSPVMHKIINEISVLSVKGLEGNEYYSPTQNDLAEGVYPLSRNLFIINCQGYSGLGMGFSSFIAGDIGQRIILKSGLLPFKTPGRNIIIRSEINNDKKK